MIRIKLTNNPAMNTIINSAQICKVHAINGEQEYDGKSVTLFLSDGNTYTLSVENISAEKLMEQVSQCILSEGQMQIVGRDVRYG